MGNVKTPYILHFCSNLRSVIELNFGSLCANNPHNSMGHRKQQAHEKAACARSGKAKKVAQSASHDESTARKCVSLAGDVGGIAGDSDNTTPMVLECDWEHCMVHWMHAY